MFVLPLNLYLVYIFDFAVIISGRVQFCEPAGCRSHSASDDVVLRT